MLHNFRFSVTRSVNFAIILLLRHVLKFHSIVKINIIKDILEKLSNHKTIFQLNNLNCQICDCESFNLQFFLPTCSLS